MLKKGEGGFSFAEIIALITWLRDKTPFPFYTVFQHSP